MTKVVEQARLAQSLDDTVGGIALRDAVQRDRCAVLNESDTILIHKQATMADLRQRFGELLRRGPFGIRPLGSEMIRI